MTKVHHMSVTRYEDDGWTWESEDVLSPSWTDIESAVRAMHDFHRPLMALHPTAAEDHPDGLMITGGCGHWVICDIGGDFLYVADPDGSDEEVEVWRSDQGFFAAAKYVVADVERVLRVARAYVEAGTCTGLNEVG